MCEKPLSGVSSDAEIIEEEAKKQGKFVMTGYQWSYSDAILGLKRDILEGKLGKPIFLKTMILWPRNTDYFKRGSGWAGKIKAPDGTIINDSVAANATAHYLHNMLFITGKEYKCSEAVNIKADLLRVNDIENFDTAVISFDLDIGGKGLFIASHTTEKSVNPIFEYRFERAVVRYDENDGMIRADFNDGTTKEYGRPSTDVHTKKIYDAINGCRQSNYRPVCTPYTAAGHVRCIEAVQREKILTPKMHLVKNNNGFYYIEGLGEILAECYEKEVMPRDTGALKEVTE